MRFDHSGQFKVHGIRGPQTQLPECPPCPVLTATCAQKEDSKGRKILRNVKCPDGTAWKWIRYERSGKFKVPGIQGAQTQLPECPPTSCDPSIVGEDVQHGEEAL